MKFFAAQMQGSEIVCAICERGESMPPNEIVLCDHCGLGMISVSKFMLSTFCIVFYPMLLITFCLLGYHQKCHNPEIGEEVLQPEVMWNCRSCVFATTAKVKLN